MFHTSIEFAWSLLRGRTTEGTIIGLIWATMHSSKREHHNYSHHITYIILWDHKPPVSHKIIGNAYIYIYVLYIYYIYYIYHIYILWTLVISIDIHWYPTISYYILLSKANWLSQSSHPSAAMLFGAALDSVGSGPCEPAALLGDLGDPKIQVPRNHPKI